jgi:hypothetical protein
MSSHQIYASDINDIDKVAPLAGYSYMKDKDDALVVVGSGEAGEERRMGR